MGKQHPRTTIQFSHLGDGSPFKPQTHVCIFDVGSGLPRIVTAAAHTTTPPSNSSGLPWLSQAPALAYRDSFLGRRATGGAGGGFRPNGVARRQARDRYPLRIGHSLQFAPQGSSIRYWISNDWLAESPEKGRMGMIHKKNQVIRTRY